MKETSSHRLVVLGWLAAALSSNAATNDLRITSIGPNTNGNITLTWTSKPGEYCTVYYADALADWTLWRIAEARIPAAGDTNVTSWTDESAQAQMAGARLLAARTSEKTLSEEEIQALIEKWKETPPEYPPLPPKEPPELLKEYWEAPDKEAFLKELRERFAGSEPLTMEGGSSSNRFYKVARIGVLGFVDGWGGGADSKPSSLTNILAVSASPWDSGAHSLALRADGTVVAWGNNFYGQCNVPTNVSDVVAITAGGRHSLALKADGTVVVWGDNHFGQVTNAPAGLTNVLDVKAGLWHSLVLRADGTVAVWGDLFSRSNAVPAGLSNVIAIAAGPRHCLALKRDRTVVGWGFDLVPRGYYRMTNAPPYLVALGTNAPAQTNGVVWLDAGAATPTSLPPGFTVFGSFLPTNAPSGLTNVVAISAGMEHNQALREDGSLALWGRTNAAVILEPPPLTNAAAIGAGWHQAVAVDTNTMLASWGQGGGPLGMDSVVGLSVGALHTLVIRTNNDSPVIRSLRPRRLNLPVGTQTNVTVEATASATPSYQWQRQSGTNEWVNLQGQTSATLQFASLTRHDNGAYRVRVSTARSTNTSWPVSVLTIYPPQIASETPDPTNVLRAAQGAQTNLGVCVSSEGSQHVLYQWFKDGVPQAGFIPAPLTSLCSTWFLTFRGLGTEGNYWAVASNEAGSVTSRVWQVRVTAIQGEAVAWGNTNDWQVAPVRTETNLIAIAAGGEHTLGLREDGTVIAWGLTNYGVTAVPAGLTNVTAIAAGVGHNLAVSNRSVVAWGNNTYGQINVPSGLTNVVAVAAGNCHSLALRADGTVVAWGATNSGQATVPAGLTNVSAIAASGWHSLALSNGAVVAWGDNTWGQSAVPAGLTNVVAIAAGTYHTLVLRRNGTVVAWGDNQYGQTNVPGGLSNVLALGAGDQHSLALRNDGTVVAWGRNNHGQTNVPPLVDVYAIAAGAEHSVALAYSPLLMYPVDVSKDLLLIVNTHSEDSTNVLNYYLAHRPGVSNANVLQISTPPGGPMLYWPQITNATYEMCSSNYYYQDIQTPYLSWLTNNPTKRPRYVLMMYHVPSRWDQVDDGWFGGCVARTLHAAVPGRKPFITHLNMGSTNDCQAYIDKLETFGNLYSPGKVVISASEGGYGNTNYLIDNKRFFEWYQGSTCVSDAVAALLEAGVPAQNIAYADGDWIDPGTSNLCRFCPEIPAHCAGCASVAGYVSWGYWGFNGGDWSRNSHFTNASRWYIMASDESWNGQWGNELGETRDGQYTFHHWFDSIAFRGTNYANTPIGALSSVIEPGVCYIHFAAYLRLWASGKNFAVCAWNAPARGSVQATGDPLVRR